MIPMFLGRHAAAFVMLLAGSVALIGAQQVLGTPANAATTEAIVETHDSQSRPMAQPASTQAVMTAAVSSGQFEELVRPTPWPTLAAEPISVRSPEPEAISAPALEVYESGVASTYGEGDGFEGNRTACGQVFHTNTVQVAHKSLPCGTVVRVEDTETGRTVEAEVTDRGPYVRGRIVDLSWAAFEQLDPSGAGLRHVNVYLLDDD
jgi:rare lipoprotein A (peptidoglycan hydrolase)